MCGTPPSPLQVANPREILLFQRTKVRKKEEKEAAARAKAGGGTDHGDVIHDDDPAAEIQGLVAKFLQAAVAQ